MIRSHNHILNLSALRELMVDPPKAQRLNRAINFGELDAITEEQTRNIIFLIEQRNKETEEYIRENTPHSLDICLKKD